MSIKVLWTKNLSAQEKEELQSEIQQARNVLLRLDAILEHKLNDVQKAEKVDFIDSAWPYKAADRNGYERAIQEIRNIIPKE